LITTNDETKTKTRVRVVPHPGSVRLPTLTMFQRQEESVSKTFQSITKREVQVTITECPYDFSTNFIFKTLDVIALIFSDKIRFPINGNT
jgi:hypothetical protein